MQIVTQPCRLDREWTAGLDTIPTSVTAPLQHLFYPQRTLERAGDYAVEIE